MDFENHGGTRTDRLRVILQHRFIGRADFAQGRSARLENCADPKSTADLHQLAAGNDDFRLCFDEVAHDQNESRRTIVYDGRGFAAAKKREIPLQISSALSTGT